MESNNNNGVFPNLSNLYETLPTSDKITPKLIEFSLSNNKEINSLSVPENITSLGSNIKLNKGLTLNLSPSISPQINKNQTISFSLNNTGPLRNPVLSAGQLCWSLNSSTISTTVDKKKKFWELYRDLALRRGGKLLSDHYIGSRTEAGNELEWQCHMGHVFKRIPGSWVEFGVFCKECESRKNNKYDLNFCQLVAAKRGGKCLSDQYFNKTPLIWRCSEGHTWKVRLHNVYYGGTWCPECKGVTKYTDEEVINHIAKKGGNFLSEKYQNTQQKITVQCNEGHIWSPTFAKILQGQWCWFCRGKIKKTIEDCHKLAEDRRGFLLSNEYINAHMPLLWECAMGHQWEACYASVNAGSWCGYCYGNVKHTIDFCRKHAESKGGKLLSDVYVNLDTPMSWECAKGHTWTVAFNNILYKDRWCPDCGGSLPYTIQECRQIARDKSGELLSTEYPGRYIKMRWRCHLGHEWNTNLRSVLRGSWCTKCRRSHGEREIVDILKKLGINFESEVNLGFLDKKRYDFYIPSMKTIIEYDGIQHFRYCAFFHQNHEHFENRKKCDIDKTRLAIINGFRIIRIDYRYLNHIDEILLSLLGNGEILSVSDKELYGWLFNGLY